MSPPSDKDSALQPRPVHSFCTDKVKLLFFLSLSCPQKRTPPPWPTPPASQGGKGISCCVFEGVVGLSFQVFTKQPFLCQLMCVPGDVYKTASSRPL